MPKTVQSQFPLGCQLTVSLSAFQKFSIKCLLAVLTDVLLKLSPTFVFFLQNVVTLLDNPMKVFSSPLKANSTMDRSLDFSLSWGTFVCDLEVSYVAIDFARFLIYVI